MFKSAATKIAHNSMIPALAGNRDLRPLQDLITAEKTVLQSLQRLSADIVKSSEFLRHWGAGEGDALQDTLNASATLLHHFATALSQYASHEQAIRDRMKAVRTREENLDELKRRRKTIMAKAESAEKKLSRMSPEHKNLQQQTELLNSLQSQIRNLDWEILSDEAKLGDFKRSSAKNWMMLKFGGLLECAEKATIVGELGKLIIDEIPLDTTQPGQGPPFYKGFDKTEKLVTEAQRCISEVVFDPVTAESQQAQKADPLPSSPDSNTLNYPDRPFASPHIEGLPSGDSGFGTQSNRTSGAYTATDGLPSHGLSSGSPSSFTANSQQDPMSPTGGRVDEFGFAGGDRRAFGTMPMPTPSGPPDGSRFGSSFTDTASASNPASPSSSRFAPSGPVSGGHFATFPLRKSSLAPDAGPGSGPSALPPPPQLPGPAVSFRPLDNSGPSEPMSFSAEIADALAHGSNLSSGAQNNPAVSQSSFSVRSSTDGPAPSYESQISHAPAFSISPTGLPRGAAPPATMNPWDEPSLPPPRFSQEAGTTPHPAEPSPYPQAPAPQYQPPAQQVDTQEHDDEGEEEDTELPYASPPPRETPQLPQTNVNREDRHVHFGGGSAEKEQTHDIGEGSMHERNPSEYDGPVLQSPHEEPHIERIPSPPPQQSERTPSPEPPMDEQSLNAAAAREVARELDALSFSPPSITMNRSPSPLVPPAPPFAQQQSPINEGATLAPASSGMFRGSRTDIRGGSTEQLAPSPSPPPPSTLQQPRPTLGAVGSSALQSFTSSAYNTPPEYPSPPQFQPPRTSSPASPSVLPPGTRTITAAAFKRPQMRVASAESRPLPEISPLSLRKKGGTPGSPYPGSERGSSPPGSVSPVRTGQPFGGSEPYSTNQDQRTRRSVDSAQNAQEHYDFIASYGEADNTGPGTSPPRSRGGPPGDTSGSPGYGSGKFATNLEEEGLR